jgi:hypothetical protein
MSAVPDDGHLPSRAPAAGIVWLPMAEPLDPDACPCGAPTLNGFCEEHTGAVAFKLPVTADGDVLPAVDWQWGHELPCPLGSSWRIGRALDADPLQASVWACPHREHPPRTMTVEYVGDDVLDAVCARCGYKWAAPWAAATAPVETTRCPGCGRPGALTLMAAIPNGGFTDPEACP